MEKKEKERKEAGGKGDYIDNGAQARHVAENGPQKISNIQNAIYQNKTHSAATSGENFNNSITQPSKQKLRHVAETILQKIATAQYAIYQNKTYSAANSREGFNNSIGLLSKQKPQRRKFWRNFQQLK